MKSWLSSFEALVVSVSVFGLNVCDAGTNQVSSTLADAQGLTTGPNVPRTPAQATPVGPAGGAPINPAGITPVNPGGPVPIRPITIVPRGVTLPNVGGNTPANPGGITPVRPGGATPINPGGPTPVNPGATMGGNPGGPIPRISGAVPVLVVPVQTTLMRPVNPILPSPRFGAASPLPSPKAPPSPNAAPAKAVKK